MTKQVTTRRDRQAVIESKRAQIVASPLTNDLAARRRDRQAVIETRLAAIVARDRGAKNLQMPAPPIAAAIDSANQGQFEQARQIVQTSSISAVVRRNVLQQIATLEATTIKPTAIRDPMQARQILALSKVQRSRDYRVKAAAGSAWRSEPSPAARSANLSVINSANSPRLAYNRLLAPNTLNNGDMQIVYPVPVAAPITSPFGWRVHPISRARRFHSGTDIGAAQGTPVLAAYSGRVKGADYMGGYGLAITIEHKNGTLDTLYAHLSQATVRPGDWVEQGAMIGEVGSTGASTGPHLHFEIRKLATDGWATLDPGPQLQQARNQLIKVTNQAHRDQPTNQG